MTGKRISSKMAINGNSDVGALGIGWETLSTKAVFAHLHTTTYNFVRRCYVKCSKSLTLPRKGTEKFRRFLAPDAVVIAEELGGLLQHFIGYMIPLVSLKNFRLHH